MTSLVADAIARAHDEGRGALVAYLPLGFPTLEESIAAVITLANNGVDVIELGIPYSDPVMDGSIIQAATVQALQNGFRLSDVFSAVAEITAATDVPVVLMSYWNPIMQYGVSRFAADLKAAGGAGIITPDITPEYAQEWIDCSEALGLDRIFLAAPSSSDERIAMIAQISTGFVYTVSTMGITGERHELDKNARELTARLKAADPDVNACVGIGISSPEHVAKVVSYADGAIVGSALVRALRDGGLSSLAEVSGSLFEATRNDRFLTK